MNLFRSFLFLSLAQICLCTACQHDKVEKENPGTAVDSLSSDSGALVLSLTPTVECLPIYYAQYSGIYKTLGLKVSLHTYLSQFDCDTALMGRTAVGGSTDLLRLHYHAEKGQYMSAVTALDGQWHLFSSADLRIKKTTLLKDRMVGVARFSTSDLISEEALRAAGMDYADVMRPQINDDNLRASMLKNHQIDAAVLPEPFATKARLAGHQPLYSGNTQLGCLVFRPSVLAVKDSLEMVKTILKGYDQAVDELNAKGAAVCRDLLLREYQLPKEVVDSLVLPKYRHATFPGQSDIMKAQHFLKERSRWSSQQTPEILFNNQCLTKY